MGGISTRAKEGEPSIDKLTSRFAYAGDERDVLHAWETFLGGGSYSGMPLRFIVERSWQRSSISGVDARSHRTPLVADEISLGQLRKRSRLITAAASTVLAENARLLAGTRTMLILTDPTGVILEVQGDPRTIDRAQDINLVNGGNWNESVIGTNAIGTAIAIGQAVQVHASEHYCEGVKSWTCAAAPIHDPRDGLLLGVLDISGPDVSFCQHNLALVLAAARQIEATLMEKLLDERAHLLEACLGQRMSHQDSMVVLDPSGCVVYLNGRASEQMSCGALTTALGIGKRIAEAGSSHTSLELVDYLPAGVSGEWLHSVTAGDSNLGSILIVPDQPQSRGSIPPPPRKVVKPETCGFSAIVGNSAAMRATRERARRLSSSGAPVLIEGETGVGKELFARAIQSAGASAHGPFITYNCGAVSGELIGSELFGYVKGAFTGASNEGRVGRFEEADGGTLCLDEIGELPLELQSYLLRVLDEGIVYRLGENKPRKIKVRLLTSTNRDLSAEVQAGRFRQDLLYRISVTTLSVPPLRERGKDIDLLLAHFVDMLTKRHSLAPVVFKPEVLSALREYNWPGNVRELRNVVESLLWLADGSPPTLADLPEAVRAQAIDSCNASSRPELKVLEQSERQAIESSIRINNGNLSRTARQLGISRSTLYRKIDQYGLLPDPSESD